MSRELLAALSRLSDPGSRSSFIEEATWQYIRHQQKAIRDQHELQLINEHEDELNREALDTLNYQAGE
ncbi:MAG: hypothetical protein EA403_10930 [Spirochaetaceae bacterium]|nr:MAG: hypothetical protein EA403_10930 [Spirochaetaceae bacterium]